MRARNLHLSPRAFELAWARTGVRFDWLLLALAVGAACLGMLMTAAEREPDRKVVAPHFDTASTTGWDGPAR